MPTFNMESDEIYHRIISSLNGRTTNLKSILYSVAKEEECLEDSIESMVVEVKALKELVNDLNRYEKLLKRDLLHAQQLEQDFSHLLQKLVIYENIPIPESALPPTRTSVPDVVPTHCRNVKSEVSIPVVAEITEENLNDVPRYMKGRLNAAQINKFIVKLNSTIQAKYQLLHRPHRSLNIKEKRQVLKFRDQETPATKGFHFCTSDDLDEFSRLKLNPALLSVIIILRHIYLVKEIREPKQPVKYAVVEY